MQSLQQYLLKLMPWFRGRPHSGPIGMDITDLSCSTLRANLASQYALLVDGCVHRLHANSAQSAVLLW
jgi:hypothetical protein